MINFKKLEEISRAMKGSLQTGKNFHTTFVFDKSKMICIANNNYSKHHPYHRFGHYRNTKNTGSYNPGLHSEVASIIRMGLEDCSHLTFVNIRIDNNGNPAISKPCVNCQNLLNEIGYKNIWYFNGEKYEKRNQKDYKK